LVNVIAEKFQLSLYIRMYELILMIRKYVIVFIITYYLLAKTLSLKTTVKINVIRFI